MIKTGHPEVSVERRYQLLGVPRASYYRGPASGLRAGDLELMKEIDKLYLEHPWMGSRSFVDHLSTPEAPIGRDRVRRLMLIMGVIFHEHSATRFSRPFHQARRSEL